MYSGKVVQLSMFKNDFDKWTSGNEIYSRSQLNADTHRIIIEWIPYDRFHGIVAITIHLRTIDSSIPFFGMTKDPEINKYMISENPQKRNVFGVLPYIAPEVLVGENIQRPIGKKSYQLSDLATPEVLVEEEYTDIYSFTIIAYEMLGCSSYTFDELNIENTQFKLEKIKTDNIANFNYYY
ncbi:hypothetical protein Glove_658g28 [Diversispora epigaea]|uniref:Protein kinase domain-containing protein n=1 Tax=Diversispora epigaea TaxID=1348612 RepID=A0A397G797_9GLOM|nr:hypothetical protein Glove_658g28 [Diversispora epigaea]